MAVLNTTSQADAKKKQNTFNNFADTSKINIIRPKTKHFTEVRFIPEVKEDGTILPTVLSVTPDGDVDVSNARALLSVVTCGLVNKFTGIIEPTDLMTPTPPDVALPFIGLWIRLKNRMKNPDKINPALLPKVMLALNRNDKKFTPLPRPDRMVFLQCVAIIENDKVLPKPALKQAVALPVTAVTGLNRLVREQHAAGVDLFSPDNGYTVKFSGLPPDPDKGRTTPTFKVELGNKLPIKEDMCRKLWVPWDTALRRYTMKELFSQMVRCFGPELVQSVFEDEYKLYMDPPAAAPVAATVEAVTPPVNSEPARAVSAPSTVALEITEEDISKPPVILGEEDEGEEHSADEPVSAPKPPANLEAASEEDLEAQMRELLGN